MFVFISFLFFLQSGRIEPHHPKVCGHQGNVLDIKWNPFIDNIIASCSEDSSVSATLTHSCSSITACTGGTHIHVHISTLCIMYVSKATLAESVPLKFSLFFSLFHFFLRSWVLGLCLYLYNGCRSIRDKPCATICALLHWYAPIIL